MPRTAKTTEPEAKPEHARGAKTAAIKRALIANPTKSAKEIAELLKEQGFETTPNYVFGVKAKLKGKRQAKKVTATPATDAGPGVPKDAVSIGLLQKAKKLAAQLGGIKEAKAAIDALAQLID